MPGEVFNTFHIIVRGSLPANPVTFMPEMMLRAQEVPITVNIVLPSTGEVDGHHIFVYWDGPQPPAKPNLVQTQLNALRNRYVYVGNIVASLSDTKNFDFGAVKISGSDLKKAYFALQAIRVTDKTYPAGYGGMNHGNELEIALSTSAGYGRISGQRGHDYLMLHEMTHNTRVGRAVVQQMFDRHVANGGSVATYGDGNAEFEQQESMTNALALQLGRQIGIDFDPRNATSPSWFPRYGYYAGDELDPQS